MKQIRIAVAFFLVWFALGATTTPAQTNGTIASFFDGSAKTIYTLAWPTATYSSYRFKSVRAVTGGFDVDVLFDGRSGINNSDLWLLMEFNIRANGIDDMKVLDDNHFLVAPFQTSIALGQAATQIARDYAAQQRSRSQTSAVCVRNSTDMDINFAYRWGTAAWIKETLQAGKAETYFYKQSTSPVFSVQFDADFAPGLQLKTYNLDRKLAGSDPGCLDATNYYFSRGSNGLDLLVP